MARMSRSLSCKVCSVLHHQAWGWPRPLHSTPTAQPSSLPTSFVRRAISGGVGILSICPCKKGRLPGGGGGGGVEEAVWRPGSCSRPGREHREGRGTKKIFTWVEPKG